MAKRRWNLHLDVDVVERGRQNAQDDGVNGSTYVERLIRRDCALRKVREWAGRGIDPEQLDRIQKELEDIL
ncbi:hypothetical protein [Microbispora sp. NPDC049633]|uniref:hypothetical protein n=1 Tax=Microbispora sp. NPDC049633 TaxID=3154355 RepID=UPI00343AB17C